MNHMAEVAKLLGVEVGEEFEIKGEPDFKCTIYNDGLYVHPVKDDLCSLPSSEQVLSRLLEGAITIKFKPYKPSRNDCYWTIHGGGNSVCLVWSDDIIDFYAYKLGNCYRTKEEAEANRKKWIDFYVSAEVLEV